MSLSHCGVTTRPSLVAKLIEALAGEEKVLEVGAGYGYLTALLAMLAVTVEYRALAGHDRRSAQP